MRFDNHRLSRAIREIEHTLIPLRDGAKLAARIWLPGDADRDPVPAILEYLPYRKRAGTYERDALTHPYFAGHGYAAVRTEVMAELTSPPIEAVPNQISTVAA